MQDLAKRIRVYMDICYCVGTFLTALQSITDSPLYETVCKMFINNFYNFIFCNKPYFYFRIIETVFVYYIKII